MQNKSIIFELEVMSCNKYVEIKMKAIHEIGQDVDMNNLHFTFKRKSTSNMEKKQQQQNR